MPSLLEQLLSLQQVLLKVLPVRKRTELTEEYQAQSAHNHNTVIIYIFFHVKGLSPTTILQMVFTIAGVALAAILLFIGVRYCKTTPERRVKW